jgi:DNA-binding CsgD family transcriptional regulator
MAARKHQELSGLFANPRAASFMQVIRPIVKILERAETRPEAVSAPPKARRKVHLTEAQMRDLVAEYLCGATTVELSAQHGIHHTTVSKYLKQRGIRIRLKVVGEKDVALAVDFYRSGLSIAKVAERIGRAPDTVRTELLLAGVKIRDVHGRERY